MIPLVVNKIYRRRHERLIKLWLRGATVFLSLCVFVRTFNVTFYEDDVHHVAHPGNGNGPGWKSRTFASIENVFQSAMMYLDFKGDDCKGCLNVDYNVLLEPKDLCQVSKAENEKPQLLLLIFTTFGERSARDAVRETWLWPSLGNTGQIRHVFLIGKGGDRHQQLEVESENEQHSDILQHDYVECIRNMTLKTISALRWVVKRCPGVQHVMKVDTDIWLNIPKWLQFISDSSQKEHLENTMIGHCRLRPAVVRLPLHKYFVSKEIYPKIRHPNYCRGPGYHLSGKLVKEIVNISYKQPYIAVEDAYVGHCLQTLGYKVYNPPGHTLYDLWQISRKVKDEPCALKTDFYMVHKVSSQELKSLWKQTSECH